MVFSAALDNGYILWSIIAILTSVIGGVYYLNLIKEIFFFDRTYNDKLPWEEYLIQPDADMYKEYNFQTLSGYNTISNNVSITISIITLSILLFVYINNEWLSMGTIVVQILFDF